MKTLDDRITAIVRRHLAYHHGNKVKAAMTLGVSIRTLRNWIKTRPALASFYQVPYPRKSRPVEPVNPGETI